MVDPALSESGAGPSDEKALGLYVTISAGLRQCLWLGDNAAAGGRAKTAAEYVLGALDDLGPAIEELHRFLHPDGTA